LSSKPGNKETVRISVGHLWSRPRSQAVDPDAIKGSLLEQVATLNGVHRVKFQTDDAGTTILEAVIDAGKRKGLVLKEYLNGVETDIITVVHGIKQRLARGEGLHRLEIESISTG